MVEVREKLVSLWAKIINREIVQENFWFSKKISNKLVWKDIDVIGINPVNSYISLYNVKANINTPERNKPHQHDPDKIAINFIDTIEALDIGFNHSFKYKLYLVYEGADRFRKRTYEKDKEAYYNDVVNELNNNKIYFKFNLKELKEYVSELVIAVTSSPRRKGTGIHCYKFANYRYFYPFHKIKELKIIDIYSNYSLKTP